MLREGNLINTIQSAERQQQTNLVSLLSVPLPHECNHKREFSISHKKISHLPYEKSSLNVTFPFSITSVKDGQPHPE